MLKRVSGTRTALYLVLLLAAMLCMASLKRCNIQSRHLHHVQNKYPDTLFVAVEYSPLGIQAQDDSLGGFGYEMMKHVAECSKLSVRFFPVVSMPKALQLFDKGRYDVVIGEYAEDHRLYKRPRSHDVLPGHYWVVNKKIQSKLDRGIDSIKRSDIYSRLLRCYQDSFTD